MYVYNQTYIVVTSGSFILTGDYDKFQEALESISIMDSMLKQRDSTKWKPFLLTNILYEVTRTDFVLGGVVDLPSYIKSKRCINALISDWSGQKYNDNLCAFRCLSLAKNANPINLTESAKYYFNQWPNKVGFKGLQLSEFPLFESIYNINLNVFSLLDGGHAIPIYLSRRRFDLTMNVNMFEYHLSYINNIDQYTNKYQCSGCDKLFNRVHNFKVHKPCKSKTSYRYKGGYHKVNPNIFEELENNGIRVDDHLRHFKYFAVYDFESILDPLKDKSGNKLKWTHKHIPVSVSVSSNVPGFTEPKCFINSEPSSLVKSLLEYLHNISDKSYSLHKATLQHIFNEIETKKDEFKFKKEQLLSCFNIRKDFKKLFKMEEEISSDIQDNDDDDDPDVGTDGESVYKRLDKKLINVFSKLSAKLDSYCKSLPVLGFNSSNYDLNLIKEHFASLLGLTSKDENNFTIKRNNSYICIATEELKFLDVGQYLPGGTSYANFLKTFKCTENKGFFPYEWFDHIEKLDVQTLPPYEAFYSNLKNTNVLDESMGEKHGRLNYEKILNIWKDQKMSSFKDYLAYYNNLDVQPFIEAVEKMQRFYFEKKVDIFKDTVSVPGVARKLLFETGRKANASFSLFSNQHKDVYDTIRSNIIGGPSIIFHRFHKVNETYIRRGTNICQHIVGYDANALYLYAIGKDLPVDYFIKRVVDDDFLPHCSDNLHSMYDYLDYLILTENRDIKHKKNYGFEIKVGNYSVDGYDSTNNLIIEFNGCKWHGHDCDLGKIDNVTTEYKKLQLDRYIKTVIRTQILKILGYQVLEMWECDFKKLKRQNKDLREFINNRRLPFYRKYSSTVTKDEILDEVKSGLLFGMVEVDIRVPTAWPDFLKDKMSLSPYDYFKEMSPLFCNTNIQFEDIGKFMQDFVVQNGLSSKPRRLLVGGMKANKILLATPLLKWYIEHGMEVTHIYQVYEFRKQKCFLEFSNQVSDARRKGDVNSDLEVEANLNKLIGNSAYGSLIMDKTKHSVVKYTNSEHETCLLVNDLRFNKITELPDHVFEIEMKKKSITFDLPIQLGYYILQYAKLRMLEFYYDFLDFYIDRSKFELIEMDTDSCYMAISANKLEDVVRPSLKKHFFTHVHQWIPSKCCGNHINDFAACKLAGVPFSQTQCCKDKELFDKRTPGLFKLEASGEEMIGLSSKTYLLTSKESCKFSCKGINKTQVMNPVTTFRTVLETGETQSCVNKGFRVKDNKVFSYQQYKSGFSYFYCKRKILDDGISTEPLDVTLNPFPT